MSRASVGVAAAVVTEVLYGCSFVFTKGATRDTDPFVLLAWRFWIALAVMGLLVLTRIVRVRITRAAVAPLLVLAILQPVIYYLAETFGVMRTTAAESGIITAVIPVGALLAGIAVLGKRPAKEQVIGILITLLGVGVTVVAGGLAAQLDVAGYLFLFAAVAAYSFYVAFADKYSQASDIDKTFTMIVVGAVVFGGVAVWRATGDGTLTMLAALPISSPGFGVTVVFLALGPTIGAFFGQNLAISRLGSARYASFIGLATLTAIVTGGLTLGERLTPWQLLGCAAILAGVLVANRSPANR